LLPLTVNWERSVSAPAPVFGYNTKQTYSPQPLDNVLDQGQFDTINPNVFRGKRTMGELNYQQYSKSNKMFSQENNNAWESNVNWANSGMNKSYQGMKVNFAQALGIDQLSTVVVQDIIPRLDKVELQYPQDPFSASAKSDTDIWNNINRYIYGKSGAESSPKGDWIADENAIFPRVQKNEAAINEIVQRDNELQNQINQAKAERDSIQEKLNGKAMRNHTHQGLGLPPINTESTQPNDLNLSSNLLPSLSLTTIALGGVAAYLLLGSKK
jgi:hypothetical protein